jgi:diguanylate cyclase (GGDEF)-like protein/PAS domain S-box-containing protein
LPLPILAGFLIAVAAVIAGLVWVRRHGADAKTETAPPPAPARRRQDPLESLAIEGKSEGLWHWDLATNKFRVSKGWASILGYNAEDIGDSPDDWFAMVHPYYLSGLRMDLAAHRSGKKDQLECEYRIRHRDGTHRWVLCRGQAVHNQMGETIELSGVQTDVTRLIEVENRLVHEALHDRLTGLPNRNFFSARLSQAVESCQRDSRRRFAVLFLDLDRFKQVNDTLGHLIGDELLASVAGRLQGCLGDNFLARFGGDEFVVLVDPLKTPSEAQTVAKRIHKSLAEPFQLQGHQLVSQASIGIALSGASGTDTEELMRNADIAMYEAKTAGKNRLRVYNPAMYERTQRDYDLENDLRAAIDRNELMVHYQPQICMKSGKIRGAEALLRWKRQNGETISPGEFIPLAEKSDLILKIGEWVLREACAEAAAWRKSQPTLTDLPIVAVNLSGRQLNQDFPALVSRVLAETGLHAENLELELTESVLLDSMERAPAVLEDVARKGVSIAIDDFGTGYSSISYLRKMTADVIKLDQSFVADVDKDTRAAALVKGMISLAHDLGITILAEGVECAEHLEFLRLKGCDFVQGYFIGLPLPADRLRALLATDRALASPVLASADRVADRIPVTVL